MVTREVDVVTMEKAIHAAESGGVNGLSNIGVELLGNSGFLASFLASDVRPDDGNVLVDVFVNGAKKTSDSLSYDRDSKALHMESLLRRLESVESDTTVVDGLFEVLGESGISPDSSVSVRFIDAASRQTIATLPAYAVWANSERDEVTLSVKVA